MVVSSSYSIVFVCYQRAIWPPVDPALLFIRMYHPPVEGGYRKTVAIYGNERTLRIPSIVACSTTTRAGDVRTATENIGQITPPQELPKSTPVRYPHPTKSIQTDADGSVIYRPHQTPSIGLYTNAKVSTQQWLISYMINNYFVRICYYLGSIKRPNNINIKPEQSNRLIFNI